MTSDFDRKLEKKLTMRKAAKKLISYLYNKEHSIPYYTNNAVTNLVILILSDGEKYLTKQKVKHNIHFIKTSRKSYERKRSSNCYFNKNSTIKSQYYTFKNRL